MASMSSAPNYYDILGVAKDATESDIKKAFRKLARTHHPDAGGDENKFKEINEAYEVLSDPEKKKIYDQYGTTSPSYAQSASDAGYSYGSGSTASWEEILNSMRGGSSRTSGFSGFSGFGDVFGDIFTDEFGGYGENLDVRAEIEVPLRELMKGIKKTISMEIDGTMRSLSFSLPAKRGASPTIRLKGQGRTGRNGEHGDVLLTIKAKMPKDIQVSGADIESVLDIPFPIAVCGGKVAHTLPSGKKVKVSVPSNTKADHIFTFKDEGIKEGGKCRLRARITIPQLSDDERIAIEKIKERIEKK